MFRPRAERFKNRRGPVLPPSSRPVVCTPLPSPEQAKALALHHCEECSAVYGLCDAQATQSRNAASKHCPYAPWHLPQPCRKLCWGPTSFRPRAVADKTGGNKGGSSSGTAGNTAATSSTSGGRGAAVGGQRPSSSGQHNSAGGSTGSGGGGGGGGGDDGPPPPPTEDKGKQHAAAAPPKKQGSRKAAPAGNEGKADATGRSDHSAHHHHHPHHQHRPLDRATMASLQEEARMLFRRANEEGMEGGVPENWMDMGLPVGEVFTEEWGEILKRAVLRVSAGDPAIMSLFANGVPVPMSEEEGAEGDSGSGRGGSSPGGPGMGMLGMTLQDGLQLMGILGIEPLFDDDGSDRSHAVDDPSLDYGDYIAGPEGAGAMPRGRVKQSRASIYDVDLGEKMPAAGTLSSGGSSDSKGKL